MQAWATEDLLKEYLPLHSLVLGYAGPLAGRHAGRASGAQGKRIVPQSWSNTQIFKRTKKCSRRYSFKVPFLSLKQRTIKYFLEKKYCLIM